jgi:predicted ATPase
MLQTVAIRGYRPLREIVLPLPPPLMVLNEPETSLHPEL